MLAGMHPPAATTASADRRIDPAVAVIAVAAGAIAAWAPGQPTLIPEADLVLKAGVAVLVTLAGSRARPWTLLVLTGASAATTSGGASAFAWLALAAMLVLTVTDVASAARPSLQSAIAAAACLCFFHQGTVAFTGASFALAIAASAPVIVTGIGASSPRVRRSARRAALVTGGLAAVGLVAFAGLIVAAQRDLGDGADQADAAIDAARDAQEDEAIDQLEASAQAFDRAHHTLTRPWVQPLRAIPVLAQHVDALEQVAAEGRSAASSPEAVEAISDYRGLKYESGRIDVARVGELADPVGDTADLLRRSGRRLEGVDQTWLLPPFANRLTKLQDRLTEAGDDASTAEEVLRLMPALLGEHEHGPRHYFVAFTTPAEARGLGGFLGNYGELEAVDGQVRMVRSGSTSDIEPTAAGTRTLTGPAEYLARYGGYQPADHLRDAPMSPNFPAVAEVIAQLYPQAGGANVDGVILMDPYALATLLEFTGPIEVPGYPIALTSENLPDIAVRQQYLDFADRNDERKDILVDATEIAFDRLLEGDLPAPGDLIRKLGPMVRQRRLMLWSAEQKEQALFETLDVEGEMPAAGGHDAFVLAHQNFGNNKVDAYLQRSLDYRATVDRSSGEVDATATITLRNDAPASGLPDYVIKNQRGEPKESNVMNLTAFSALGLRSAILDGEEVSMPASREGGLNAYDLRLTIPPGATRTLVLDLGGGVDLRSGPYRLTVAPQPSVHPDLVTVAVDGRPARRCGTNRSVGEDPRKLRETLQVGSPGCERSTR